MNDIIEGKIENLYTPDCIRTYTGIYMNVFEPTLDMICIEDIAHALSMQCRFGGHLPVFYSVAQHSVMCSKLANQDYKLQALLHDASEAYLMDIPRPIKQRLSNYKEIEASLMALIAEKYEFDSVLSKSTKAVDEYMLQWEWSTIMLKREVFKPIECWNQEKAKEIFIETFIKLSDVC
jgi:hypothetical protein